MSTRTGKGWIARLRDGLIVVGVTDPAQTIGGRILAAHIKLRFAPAATLRRSKVENGLAASLSHSARLWLSAQ